MPITNAPIFRPDLPPSTNQPVPPNAGDPVTGSLVYYRASGLALATAIALWNAVYLGRALDDLRAAPVGWQHINLTGDYLWDADSGFALVHRHSSHGSCRLMFSVCPALA